MSNEVFAGNRNMIVKKKWFKDVIDVNGVRVSR